MEEPRTDPIRDPITPRRAAGEGVTLGSLLAWAAAVWSPIPGLGPAEHAAIGGAVAGLLSGLATRLRNERRVQESILGRVVLGA